MPSGESYVLAMHSNTLSDAFAVINELAQLAIDDLMSRFANLGISRYVYILEPGYQEPLPVVPGQAAPAGAHGSLEVAVQEISDHMNMDAAPLKQQFRLLLSMKIDHLFKNPEARSLAPFQFWPPLLKQCQAATPLACSCVAALIVLSYQNCDVERDLAILKAARQRSAANLLDNRMDHVARILIEGPKVEKQRTERLTGPVKDIARDWASMRRRMPNAATHKYVGLPGKKVPARGNVNPAGPLRQALPEVPGSLGVRAQAAPAEEEEVSTHELFEFLS